MRKTIFTNVALAAALAVFHVAPASAEFATRTLPYDDDGMSFEAYAVWNPDLFDTRGIVYILPDWTGLDGYERTRAQMLAAEGYTAVALDLYGTEAHPQGFEDYRRLSSSLLGDRAALRQRVLAGLGVALDLPGAHRGAAMIGYCFGGTAAMEAALAGAPMEGFALFHGGLRGYDTQDFSVIGGEVMIYQGSADPATSMSDLAVLVDRLRDAEVIHGLRVYGGVRHAFTVWGGRDYDGNAEADSWRSLVDFLDRLF